MLDWNRFVNLSGNYNMQRDLTTQVIKLARNIQQIAAPTFSEGRRGKFVLEQFRQIGLSDVEQDSTGNVYARLPGSESGLPLVVTAHLDTVFPDDTDLSLRNEKGRVFGPGIGDNSLGVAGLFGLFWMLQTVNNPENDNKHQTHTNFHGDLWFVANTAEEGLGNLRGMHSVVNRFGGDVLGYLVLEGMALGQIFHRGLGVKRYRVTVRTTGGHSWVDYGRASAVHELGELISQLTNIDIPAEPRTTLNIGVISGGTSVNTIAAEAFLELDLRSENPQTLDFLVHDVESICSNLEREDVKIELTVIGERPAGEIPSNHPLVEIARKSIESKGYQPNLSIGSTDANVPLSLGYPAICTGITRGDGAHTINESIITEPIQDGLEIITEIVEETFANLG